MTPQQQVLGVLKIQLQGYEGQAIYTGLHLMMIIQGSIIPECSVAKVPTIL